MEVPSEVHRTKGAYSCKRSGKSTSGKWEFGAIIGSVIIADCVQNHPSVWAEKDCWNWVLKDAVLFDKPIEGVKGKLSFWEYNFEEYHGI